MLEASHPRLYEAFVSDDTIAGEVTGQIVVAGDLHNAARMFPYYYYERSRKTLTECLAIGVHAIRIAKQMNTMLIRNPNVRFYSQSVFRKLTPAELEFYKKVSEPIDAVTLNTFRTTPDPS